MNLRDSAILLAALSAASVPNTLNHINRFSRRAMLPATALAARGYSALQDVPDTLKDAAVRGLRKASDRYNAGKMAKPKPRLAYWDEFMGDQGEGDDPRARNASRKAERIARRELLREQRSINHAKFKDD